MAEWKKVVVSGSSAELANLKVDGLTSGEIVIGGGSAGNLTTTGSLVGFTFDSGTFNGGTFSGGTFTGDGSGLTGISADSVANSLTDGNGIVDFTFDGSAGATVAVQSDTTTGGNTVGVAVGANGVGLDVSGIAGTGIEADGSGNLRIAAAAAGNGLTGGAGSALAVSASNTTITVGANGISANVGAIDHDSLLNFVANEHVDHSAVSIDSGNGLTGGGDITTTRTLAVGAGTGITVNADDVALTGAGSLTTNTITKWDGTGLANSSITDDGTTVSINSNMDVTTTGVTISGDLIVEGTASFQESTNTTIADRFILLASGSSAAGDGGIVVQQATQGQGEVFAFENAAARWGIASTFDADSAAVTIGAYMAAVIDIDAGQTDVAAYQKNGNIKVDSGDIFIYA